MKYLVFPIIFFIFSIPSYSGEMDGQGLICNKQGGYGKTYLSPIFFEHGVVKEVVVEEYDIEKHLMGDYTFGDLTAAWRHVLEKDEFSERVFDRKSSRLSITQHFTDIVDPIYSEWDCEVTDWAGIELYMRNEIAKLMEAMEENGD